MVIIVRLGSGGTYTQYESSFRRSDSLSYAPRQHSMRMLDYLSLLSGQPGLGDRGLRRCLQGQVTRLLGPILNVHACPSSQPNVQLRRGRHKKQGECEFSGNVCLLVTLDVPVRSRFGRRHHLFASCGVLAIDLHQCGNAYCKRSEKRTCVSYVSSPIVWHQEATECRCQFHIRHHWLCAHI
jgi:hypothetical protein